MQIKDFNKFHRSVTFYSVYVICPIANIFSYFFYKRNIHPNCITILSSIFAFLGTLVLIMSRQNLNHIIFLTVFMLWNLSYVFDICDGQIARAKNQFSQFGEWLDHSLDAFNKFIMISGMFYINYFTLPSESKEQCFIIYSLALGFSLCLFNAVMCKDFIFGKKSNSTNKNFKENLIIHILQFFMALTNQAIQFWFLFFLLIPKLFLTIVTIYYLSYMIGYFIYMFLRFYKNKIC